MKVKKPSAKDDRKLCHFPETQICDNMKEAQVLRDNNWKLESTGASVCIVDKQALTQEMSGLRNKQREHGSKTRTIIDFLEHGNMPESIRNERKFLD